MILDFNTTVQVPLKKDLFSNTLIRIENYLKIPNTSQNQLSLVIVGRYKIKALNKKFRQKDSVTDVLSFSFVEPEYQKKILPILDNNMLLGEIYICYNKALQQSKRLGHSIEQELEVLFIHGFLHIIGYDHIEDSDFTEMNLLENHIYDYIKS